MCELTRRIGCDGARTATTLHVEVAMWVSGATSVTRSVGNPTSRYDEAPAVGQTCAEASFRARPLCHTTNPMQTCMARDRVPMAKSCRKRLLASRSAMPGPWSSCRSASPTAESRWRSTTAPARATNLPTTSTVPARSRRWSGSSKCPASAGSPQSTWAPSPR